MSPPDFVQSQLEQSWPGVVHFNAWLWTVSLTDIRRIPPLSLPSTTFNWFLEFISVNFTSKLF